MSKGKGRVGLLGSCETLQVGNSICKVAKIRKDNKMLTKISDVDFIAKEVKYHHSCKSKYLKSVERANRAPHDVFPEKTCG